MIKLRELEFNRLCSSCLSETDVMELEIERVLPNGSNGTVVALCRECRDTLERLLIEKRTEEK